MNYFGSYRALLGNATAALAAGIEIYNKPNIRYRDECSVILLVNAWELALKATLSKMRVRIFYPKKRGQPYRTLSLTDALSKAHDHFPAGVDYRSTAGNIALLADYRNRSIHFYNKPGFGALVYSLAQTCIVNFSDFVREVFGRDLSDEVTLSLLPLGLAPPVDPVQFLRATANNGTDGPVQEFSTRLRDLVVELEDNGHDTGRLLTTFEVKLESTKKVTAADLVVGVESTGRDGQPLLIQRRLDPNLSHPYREMDIIASLTDPDKQGMSLTVGGRLLTQHPFRAIGYHHEVKSKPKWCWRDQTGVVTKYSPEYIQFLKRLSRAAVDAAIKAYTTRSGERDSP